MEEDLTHLWLSPNKTGKPGASFAYSEKAIGICLSLRVLLRLPLRQTQGFVRSVLCLAGMFLPVPNYSTLCRRRQKCLPVALGVSQSASQCARPRHIVID